VELYFKCADCGKKWDESVGYWISPPYVGWCRGCGKLLHENCGTFIRPPQPCSECNNGELAIISEVDSQPGPMKDVKLAWSVLPYMPGWLITPEDLTKTELWKCEPDFIGHPSTSGPYTPCSALPQKLCKDCAASD
jgi:hypothetical protein